MQELIAQFLRLLRPDLKRATNGAQASLAFAYSPLLPLTNGFTEAAVSGKDRDLAEHILHFNLSKNIAAAEFSCRRRGQRRAPVAHGLI